MIDDKEMIWGEIIDQYGDKLDKAVETKKSDTISLIKMSYRGVDLQIHIRFEVDKENFKEPDCKYTMQYHKLSE